MFWIGQNTNPTLIHSLNLHCMKAPCLKEHANFSAPHHIQARPRVRITPHMSSNCSLITRHKTRRQLSSTCTYMRVTLLHPQDMINFSLQFLHTLSQFHYWLERWSDNMPAGTFRSLWRLLATVPEHFPPPLPLIHYYRTDQETINYFFFVFRQQAYIAPKSKAIYIKITRIYERKWERVKT